MKSVIFCLTTIFLLANSSYGQTWYLNPLANFGGGGRAGAVGFSITHTCGGITNQYGFAGTGSDGVNLYKDFWRYNAFVPGANTWTQMASLPAAAAARSSAVGFSLNGRGYICTGGFPLLKDMWVYDPCTNTWFAGTSMPAAAVPRYTAVAFVINNKAYVGSGFNNNTSLLKDFWEFDPVPNTWHQVTTPPATFVVRQSASAFSLFINNITYGYVACGATNPVNSTNYLNDLWRYQQGSPTWAGGWVHMASMPPQAGLRYGASGLSIMNLRGFVGLGSSGTNYLGDWWEYNGATNVWTQRPNYPGSAGASAIALDIKGGAYVGTGFGGTYYTDWYEYSPCPGCAREEETNQNNPLVQEYNIFPNPCAEYFNLATQIKPGRNEVPVIISIFNIRGEKVKTVLLKNISQQIINVKELINGLYLLEIENNAGTIISRNKLLIQK
ncbi:MAG TPA: kelch repeat-containing protein [Bacteroidia bacterium]|nr:kelch repeat-containing protein [Bacteroidia bacterium]